MELRVKKSALMLAMGVVLALTSVGCGDDDEPAAGSGGTGGTGGTGATSGTGGTGGAPTEAMCVTAVETATSNGVSSECSSCLCEMEANRAATIACNEGCWGLVQCVAASGCATTDITCISGACASFLGSAGPAMAFSPIVQACAPCIPDTGMDAGTDDAGN